MTMYKTIAIDGACRRNGKEDCLAAGACFIVDTDDKVDQCYTTSIYEENSTSQRGELYGLLQAVEHVSAYPVDTVVVTDSEYLFNTMTKEWVDRWMAEGWITAQGTPVKNKDLWEQIWWYYDKCRDLVSFYHIKGHLLSVGTRQYHIIMNHDKTGHDLYTWAYTHKGIPNNKVEHAVELFEKNNGFRPDDSLLLHFASMNLVADAVANLCVESVEQMQWQSILNNSVPAAESMV